MDVRVFGSEQLFGPLNGQFLCNIHKFATAIPALGRISFGVFVGKGGSLHLHHRWAGKVFAGDQLDVFLLTGGLLVDDLGNLGVDGRKSVLRTAGFHLVDPALVASAGFKLSLDELVENTLGQVFVHAVNPDAEHVGVVVQACADCGGLVGDQRRPDAGRLVSGNAHAHAGSAKQHAQPALAGSHRGGDFLSVVRVVRTILRVTPKIGDRNAFFLEVMNEDLLEFVPGMIGAERDFHHRLRLANRCPFVLFD